MEENRSLEPWRLPLLRETDFMAVSPPSHVLMSPAYAAAVPQLASYAGFQREN